jgi:penicillin-binding protein 1A
VGLPAFLLETELNTADLEAVAEDIKQAKADEESIEPRQAPRVLTPQNAWLMTSMLQSVVKRGTAVRAKSLGRKDLAGKTGTTNDQHDAWFSGFNADYVTTAWVGFDQPRSLGKSGGGRETGASVGLPMWIAFMREALKGKPNHVHPQPDGLTTVRIDPETALLARPEQNNAIFEYFRNDLVPTKYSEKNQADYFLGETDTGNETATEFDPDASPDATDTIPDQLF